MKRYVSGLVLASLVGSASLLLAAPIAPARAQTMAASPAQADALIEDIKAHKQTCDKVDASQTALIQQCANEQAALVARQQKLGISDDTVNGKLKTRGWRWP
jgi:gas vesicle protein